LHQSSFYFWRSNNGVEVDLIIENGLNHTLIEIKSGSNFTSEWFKNMALYKSYSNKEAKQLIIYTGTESIKMGENKELIPYSNMHEIL
jgi:predicted AAA+ superfamily ATPase